jgi:hypothetical protein
MNNIADRVMCVCRNNGIDIEDKESLKEIDSLAYISPLITFSIPTMRV